jgi:hypothetical protein
VQIGVARSKVHPLFGLCMKRISESNMGNDFDQELPSCLSSYSLLDAQDCGLGRYAIMLQELKVRRHLEIATGTKQTRRGDNTIAKRDNLRMGKAIGSTTRGHR